MENNILSRLENVKASGPDQWKAKCPAHSDDKPSLSIKKLHDGTILLRCFANCNAAAIVSAIGLELKDLFPPRKASGSGPGSKLIATYDYTDGEGKLLYQVCRFSPKDFRQRIPDGAGGWSWKLNGTARVLYRLPALLKADAGQWTFIVEGEKDADNLHALGLLATCNSGGAGRWNTLKDDSALYGRRVCVILDKDSAGRAHGADVASRLTGKAAMVKVIEAPSGKDSSDYVENCRIDGKDDAAIRETFLHLAESAPGWTPAAPADALSEVFDRLDAEASGELRPFAVPFAERLNCLCRLTEPASLAVLAGSPGSAKSFFALNLLVAAADAGLKAVYLPLESDKAFHLRRLAAVLDGSWAALGNSLTDSAAPAKARAVVSRHESRLRELADSILENPYRPIMGASGKAAVPNVSSESLLATIEEQAARCRLVVFDPWSLIPFRGRDRWSEENDFAGRLTGIAAQSGAVIVAVCHLTKKPIGKRLELGDIQGGASLSRLAGTVLLMERFDSRDVEIWADDAMTIRDSAAANMRLSIGKARFDSGTGFRIAFEFGKAGPTFQERGIIAPRQRVVAEAEHWAND